MLNSDCFETVESSVQPLDETLTADNFWQGISVWLSSPHVVNRRLFGIKVLSSGHFPNCTKLDICRFVDHCVQREFVQSDGKILVTELLGQPTNLAENFVFKNLKATPELGVVYLFRQLLLKTEEKTADSNREIVFLGKKYCYFI